MMVEDFIIGLKNQGFTWHGSQLLTFILLSQGYVQLLHIVMFLFPLEHVHVLNVCYNINHLLTPVCG